MRRKLPEDVLQELVEQVLVERLREQICRIISTRYSKYFNSILSYFISNMMKAYIYLFSLGSRCAVGWPIGYDRGFATTVPFGAIHNRNLYVYIRIRMRI